MLNLVKVSRLDMGAYMCIASNGVPPAVSKRIQLGIDCKLLLTDLHIKTSRGLKLWMRLRLKEYLFSSSDDVGTGPTNQRSARSS